MNTLLVLFFSSLVTLALVHNVSLQFYLYWKYPWLDMPIHFLGGVCVALFMSILPFFRVSLRDAYTNLFGYALIALSVGILWEAFEVFFSIADTADPDYAFDTIIDLCMDVLGGMLGYALVRSVKKIGSWQH